jgi:hypothetical protein
MAALLALLEQPGLVTVVQVEPRPEGGVRYALRAMPERAPSSGATVPSAGETLAALVRLAGAVAEGGRAGLVLRDPSTLGTAATPRGEVTALGILLREIAPRLPTTLTPALEAISRRAVDAQAPDRYESTAQLRSDLVRLQRTLPITTQAATAEFSRVAQVLTQLDLPDMVAVQNVTVLGNGRTSYGLHVLGGGEQAMQSGLTAGDDLLGAGIRLGDAIIAGRDVGMQLREVATRGVTLPLVGLEGRAELVGLATVLRELLPAMPQPLHAPLAALLGRALEPEVEERLDDVAALRDELARQQQAARLIPQEQLRPQPTPKSSGMWWFVAILVVLTFAALLIG